jgi:hypothetical protein
MHLPRTLPGRPRVVAMARDMGRQACELTRGVVEQMVQRPFGHRGEQSIEHLGEGLIGHARVPAGPADEHGDVMIGQRRCDLGDQPRLACARFAADEHEVPVALLDRRPDPLQRLQLRSAADQRHLARCGQLRHALNVRPCRPRIDDQI